MLHRFIMGIGVGFFITGTAAAQNLSWAAANSGDWNNAANWSPPNVPDSATESALLNVAGAYTVTLNISPTILGLSIGNAGAILDMPAGRSLSLTDTAHANNGLIRINPTGAAANTLLSFGATGSLSGIGEVRMNGAVALSQLNTGAGFTLTQSAAHRITGRGQVNAALTNNGLVSADVSGHTLFLLTSPKTNNDRLEATNDGILEISGITVTQGAAGRIVADDGTVRLVGVSGVSGGELESANGGLILVPSGSTNTLTNVTNTAAFDIQAGGAARVLGTGLVNDALLQINPNGAAANATLNFDATGSLSGTGEVRMNGAVALSQLNTGVGVALTQSAAHRISGRGQVNAALTNNGLVSADVNGHTLFLQNNAKTNNNLLEATNDGILEISGIAVTQGAAGRIVADDGTVRLVGVSGVSAGELESTNGGLFLVPSGSTNTLTDVTSTAAFDIQAGGTVRVLGAGLVNDALLQVNPTGGAANTVLSFDNTGSLSGTGEVRMNGAAALSQLNTGGGALVTQPAGHRITGRGQINAALTNSGLVSANLAGQTLTLQTNAKTNNDRIEAINGATLEISGITVTQGAAGRILANDGTVRLIGTSGVSAGQLQSANGGLMLVPIGSTNTLTNVTSTAAFDIQAGGTVRVLGAGLVNDALLQVNPTGGAANTVLSFDNTGSLSGTGEVRMNGAAALSQLNTGGGAMLTQPAGHRIRGRGQINAALTNSGLVSANVDGQTLFLQTNAKTNNDRMEAINGGTLEISGITVTQGALGRIVANGGGVRLVGASGVSAGRLESAGGGLMVVPIGSTNTLTNVTSAAALNIEAGGTVRVLGAGLVNDALLQINPTGGAATTLLSFDATGSLSGTGEVRMNGPSTLAQLNTGAGFTLTQSAGHRVTGRGNVSAALINNGLVQATVAGQTLDLLSGAKTNNGLMRATNTGTLQASVNVDGTGAWSADGGTVRVQPGVQVTTTGRIDSRSGGAFIMSNAANVLTGSDLYVDADSTFTGFGSVTLSGNYLFRPTIESRVTWPAASNFTMTGGNGGTSCNTTTWAHLEVGGTDNGTGGTGTNNFGMGNVTIGAGAEVTLSDYANNGNRGGPSGTAEALYATSLTLGAGATLNLNGIHVYVGGVLIGVGPRDGGVVVNTPVYLAGDLNCDGVLNGLDVAAYTVAALNPLGYPAQFPGCNICSADMNADGTPATPLDAPLFINALMQAIP